jgi:hypothetical protein
MTFGDFAAYQGWVLERVTGMSDTKGKEYANSEDNRFANFDRLSKEIKEELGYDLPNYVVGYIFFKKHLDSIKSYIKSRGTGTYSEPINGRFVDAVTYLTLIGGMIEEGEKEATFMEKDNCQMCHGMSGGVRGNEIRLPDGMIVCDYCHAKMLVKKYGTELIPCQICDSIYGERRRDGTIVCKVCFDKQVLDPGWRREDTK